MRDVKKGRLQDVKAFDGAVEKIEKVDALSHKQKIVFAILIPLLFALNVIAMFTFNLQGGDATALVGGTAILIFSLLI